MFLAIHGTVGVGLLVYFVFWLLAPVTGARIQRPLQATIIQVQYRVNGHVYKKELLRSGIPFAQKEVAIRYIGWQPQWARVNSFMGLAAEPLTWWLVLLLASAMLLLTNNTVFSKGTVFQLHKGFPWITMDEYFPAANNEQPQRHQHAPSHKNSRRRLPNK